MIIFMLTTQKNVGNKIAQRLREKYNYIVAVFTKVSKFRDAAFVEGPARVDLLMVDYLAFLNDELNPFEQMVMMEKVFPFIYYNTPFALEGHRVEYWYNKIMRHIKSFIPESKIPSLITLFSHIDEVITAPDIMPYIRLLNEPPELVETDEELSEEDKEKALLLENYRKMGNIPRSRFRVLEFMYEHIGEEINEDEICSRLWNECSKKKIDALYTYISELRKSFGNEHSELNGHKFLIERTRKKCYRLTLA